MAFVNQIQQQQQAQKEQQAAQQIMQMGYYASLAQQRQEAEHDRRFKSLYTGMQMKELPLETRLQFGNDLLKMMGVQGQMNPDMLDPWTGVMRKAVEARSNGTLPEIAPLIEYGVRNWVTPDKMPEAMDLQREVQGIQASQAADLSVPNVPPTQDAQLRLQRRDQPTPADLELFGGEAGWKAQLMKDEGAVGLYEQRQAAVQRREAILRANPSLIPDVLKGSLKVGMKPEDAAAQSAFDIMAGKDRREWTPDEQRTVEAYFRMYKPDAADKMGFETAAGRYQRLTNDLDHLKNRSALINQAANIHSANDDDVAKLMVDGQAGLENPGAVLDEKQADLLQSRALLLRDQLNQGKAVFDQVSAQYAEALGAQGETAKAEAAQLGKSLAFAAPADRALIQQQVADTSRVAASSTAMARLLTDLSPYALAEQEMRLTLLTAEGKVQQRTGFSPSETTLAEQISTLEKTVQTMRQERKQALMTVSREQSYLAQQETVLQSKLQASQAAKDTEEMVRQASQAAYRLRYQEGLSWPRAILTATKDMPGVDIKAVNDAVKPWKQDDDNIQLSLAQQDLATRVAAWRTQHPGKEPEHQDILQMATAVQKARPGIDRKSILEGVEGKPLVVVNTGQKASEVAAAEFTKETRQTYNQLKNAPMLLNNIEAAKQLIPQAKGFMGPAGSSMLEAAKFLNNRLGARIDMEGVKSAEELRTRLFYGIMENLKKLDAQPSELQQRLMMEALGTLGTDPNALVRVLDSYEDTIRDKVEQFNTEVKGAQEKGVDFIYDPTITLPERKGPQGEPVVRSDADYHALPPGTVYIDPQGRRRKKQ